MQVPRGKWYCHGCVAKAPPPKKRSSKKPNSRDSKTSLNAAHSQANLSAQTLNMSAQSLNTSTQSLNSSSSVGCRPITPLMHGHGHGLGHGHGHQQQLQQQQMMVGNTSTPLNAMQSEDMHLK